MSASRERTGQPGTPGAPPPSARAAAPTRRELAVAVAGAVLAGGLALTTGGRPWADVTADRRPPLPPVSATVTGAEAAPLVPAAGLLLLAAAVALLAVRGAGRTAVGLLVLLAGAALGWSGVRALVAPDVLAAELAGVVAGGRLSSDVAAAWPTVAAVAGGLAGTVGLLAVVRGRRWPAMGRRYERPGASPAPAAPATDEERAQDAWRALDRGEDPTRDDRTDDPTRDGPTHAGRSHGARTRDGQVHDQPVRHPADPAGGTLPEGPRAPGGTAEGRAP